MTFSINIAPGTFNNSIRSRSNDNTTHHAHAPQDFRLTQDTARYKTIIFSICTLITVLICSTVNSHNLFLMFVTQWSCFKKYYYSAYKTEHSEKFTALQNLKHQNLLA